MNSKLAVWQLRKMRKMVEGNDLRLAAEWSGKYEILIATILSAVTRDEVTISVCEKLFEKYPTMVDLSRASVSTVEKIVRRVNYYKTKAKHIVGAAKMLAGKKIPETTDELVKLPGVGRKVANVYLVEAHRKEVIGVDTHVARISFKLGWTESRNPLKVEKDLEKLFPKKYWIRINDTLVRFGKIHGRSRKKEDLILGTFINRC